MAVPLVCRWREQRTSTEYACHSRRYIAPPNTVALDFCARCGYRDHESSHPLPTAEVEAADPLLPLPPVGPRWTDLPPIFCITCRQTPERTALAAAHFRERGLDVRLFPGIHGRTFGLRTTLYACPDYRMPAGHVGLVLSHWMLWQTLCFLPHPEVLILEDDAFFEPDFPDRFRETYAELPADWHFVFVGSVGTEDKPTRFVSARVAVVRYPFGLQAYLVKRAVLPFLLRTNQQARTHADIQLIENTLPHLNVYTFLPSLVRQHTYERSWPTSAGVSEDETALTRVAPTGYWVGTEDYGHHFDASLAAALADLFAGCTVVDLGCGTGRYVRALAERGIACDGYDGNPMTPLFHPACRVVDLSGPIRLDARYDWVLSLEVGEHIPALYEDVFLDNLHRHNARGIVLSWARPGQGGHGHCNERDNDHVRRKLQALGYQSDKETERQLRAVAGIPWFQENLMVFVPGNVLPLPW